MFYRVKNVTPLEDFILLVSFENGETKKYDVKTTFERWSDFQSLKNIYGLYEEVRVDAGGYAVRWNDDLDLACNELYHNGDSI